MFWGKIKKNNVYPYKPQFYYIKVGFMGVKIIKACFRDVYLIVIRFRIYLRHVWTEKKGSYQHAHSHSLKSALEICFI